MIGVFLAGHRLSIPFHTYTSHQRADMLAVHIKTSSIDWLRLIVIFAICFDFTPLFRGLRRKQIFITPSLTDICNDVYFKHIGCANGLNGKTGSDNHQITVFYKTYLGCGMD